jgi:hypothetical protein
MADVIIDQRDLPLPSVIHGPDYLARGLRDILPLAVARAQQTWRRGATLSGILELVREIRNGHTNNWRYDNYTQLPLAYAFLCAKTGDLQSAESELAHYLTVDGLDDNQAARLRKLARDYAAASS